MWASGRFAGIFEQPDTTANIIILPYKEEVAGSIGYRLLEKSGVFEEERGR
jgi:hypothetical protein